MSCVADWGASHSRRYILLEYKPKKSEISLTIDMMCSGDTLIGLPKMDGESVTGR